MTLESRLPRTDLETFLSHLKRNAKTHVSEVDDFGENLYFFKRTTPWQNTNLVPRVLSTDHGNEVEFLGKIFT